MLTRILCSTRHRAVFLGVVVVASLAPPPALASAVVRPPASCSSGTADDAALVLARVDRQLAVTSANLVSATATSPAAWRLNDEAGWLEVQDVGLRQLGLALAARDDATPGSAAQWRAQESTDALCDELP
jgi:hypothetical protein